MGTCGLPNMCTLGPQAYGPQALGVHIRQTTCVHVTNTSPIQLGRYFLHVTWEYGGFP